MSIISVKGLAKQWDDVKAVNDVSFEAKKGEFIALLGPSGCGKSTTLMMLAGLEEPSAGTVSFDGEDVTHLPPGKRRLSMVFQSYALFPHLNVEQNILFGLKARKVKAIEQRKRLSDVLDIVDLGAHIHRDLSIRPILLA